MLQPLCTSEAEVYLYQSEAHPSFAPVSAPELASASVPCWRVFGTSVAGDVNRRKLRRDATNEEVRIRTFPVLLAALYVRRIGVQRVQSVGTRWGLGFCALHSE